MTKWLLTSILSLLSTAGSVHAEMKYEQSGSWIIGSELDPFSETIKVVAFSQSIDEIFIMLRCWDGRFDIFLSHEIYGFDGWEWTEVGMRIGDSKPTFSDWKILENNNVIARPEPFQMAKEIAQSDASKLLFRLQLSGRIETPVFDLDGFDVGYKKTIDACTK